MTKKRTDNSIAEQADKLLDNEPLAILERADGRAIVVVDAQRVVTEAEAIAFSDITHVLTCATIEDLRNLPAAVRAAIKSVEQIETHIGKPTINEATGEKEYPMVRRRLKIQMHDKIDCLKLLALITKAIDTSGDPDDDNRPAFTGFTVLLPPSTKGE